jgi:transcriptional regulator with XRE-family HTH domain
VKTLKRSRGNDCGMSVGTLLKAWREKVGDLTQENMAEACDMTRSHYGDIERDRSSPTVRTLLRLIETLERRGGSFGPNEDRRLARFFLGPSASTATNVILLDEDRRR